MVIALIFNVISAFYSRVSKIAKVELWQHYAIYGYSFMLHAVEEQMAADHSKAEACDELKAYLDAPTFKVITDIVGWWGVSLTSLPLDDAKSLIYHRDIPHNTLCSHKWPVIIYQFKAHLLPPNMRSQMHLSPILSSATSWRQTCLRHCKF